MSPATRERLTVAWNLTVRIALLIWILLSWRHHHTDNLIVACTLLLGYGIDDAATLRERK